MNCNKPYGLDSIEYTLSHLLGNLGISYQSPKSWLQNNYTDFHSESTRQQNSVIFSLGFPE